MEQMRTVMSESDITEVMKRMERTGKYAKDVLQLVKDDYKFGLTTSEVELYLEKKLTILQMQMVSKALRNHGIELAKVIAREDLDHHCMQVAIDFYEKGVPLDAIAESVVEKQNAHALRYLYQKILTDIKSIDTTKPIASGTVDTSYVEQMLEEMKRIAIQISHDDKRFEALSEKISEMGAEKRSDKEVEELHNRLEEKDLLINSQQDNIQQANAAVARLRQEAEEKDKEMEKLKETIDGLKKELGKKPEVVKKADVVEIEERQSEAEIPKQMVGTVKGQYPLVYGIPVQYAATVRNEDGNPPILTMIEKSEPKRSGLYALLGKLAYKKKSRQDIVKLVASGNLKTEQLMQIRAAIQKGLTESQLLDLINNNVSADQMKEIIEIAVLENSLQ